jgi:hypothetical protein
LSLLGADTSIKSGEVILVVWIQTSLVGEMMSFQLLLGVFYLRVNANPHSVNIMQIMIQWTGEKGQTTIYKTLHRKLMIEQHKPH